MSTDAQQLESMAAEAMSSMKGMGLGAPFLATTCDALLMGVIICQMTHWLPMAKHDARHVRILVGIASAAALLGTAFTWATYMTAFVYDYGQYTRFVSLEFLGWYGALDMLIVVPVQIFFSERSIRINGNSKIILVINTILILATASLGISMTIFSRGQNTFNRTSTTLAIVTAWPTVCTSTHIWITSTILYGLIKSRSISERANKLLGRLIVVSIESQFPSTIVAMCMVLVILIDNKSPLVPFIAVVHPKVFAVGMLALVNLRHSWRLKDKASSSQNVSWTTGPLCARPTMVSLGSTVECAGVQTPKCDLDSTDNLARQQSAASAMELGKSAPLFELKGAFNEEKPRVNRLYS